VPKVTIESTTSKEPKIDISKTNLITKASNKSIQLYWLQ